MFREGMLSHLSRRQVCAEASFAMKPMFQLQHVSALTRVALVTMYMTCIKKLQQQQESGFTFWTACTWIMSAMRDKVHPAIQAIADSHICHDRLGWLFNALTVYKPHQAVTAKSCLCGTDFSST